MMMWHDQEMKEALRDISCAEETIGNWATDIYVEMEDRLVFSDAAEKMDNITKLAQSYFMKRALEEIETLEKCFNLFAEMRKTDPVCSGYKACGKILRHVEKSLQVARAAMTKTVPL